MCNAKEVFKLDTIGNTVLAPNEKVMAVASAQSSQVKVLSTATLETVYTVECHSGVIKGITFNVGNLMVVSSEDKSISIHDIEAQKVLAKVNINQSAEEI